MVQSRTMLLAPSFVFPILLVMGPPGDTQTATSRVASICFPGEAPRSVSLSEFWSLARDAEPAYDAQSEWIQAEEAVRQSSLREWLPSGSFTALGNHGQRLSPSEERALGVGPRGEGRVLAAWNVMDSDRLRRTDVAGRRLAETELASETFDLVYRTDLALLWVEAAAAEELVDLHHQHFENLEKLAEPVRLRIAAGLDATWEDLLLDETTSRAFRLLLDAEQLRDGLRESLGHLAGGCIRPAETTPDPTPPSSPAPLGQHPEVRQLRATAATHEALARQEADRGQWQLQVVGTAGPIRSRAFDPDPWRNEYLVGLSATWVPDFGGVRRQMAASEDARGRALEAQALSLMLALEREYERTRVELAQIARRRQALEAELVRARLRDAAALERWQEGVGRWTEVVDARDRMLELQVLKVSLSLETASTIVRQERAAGRMGTLPARLGEEGTL